MGQPEMERELSRFRETAQQDQDQCRQVQRALLDHLAVLQDHAQIIAAHDIAEDQHPTDQRQPAHAGHRQRHPRALTPLRQVFPIANQQEG